MATDDAVSNDAENSWRKIASGMWTANNNPADRWTSCRSAIQYINLFLANADKVKWAKDEVVAQMFCDREKAEAYACVPCICITSSKPMRAIPKTVC